MALDSPGSDTTATRRSPWGVQNDSKKGAVFAPLLLTENSLAAPKRGPPCGPQNASEGGTTPVAFLTHPARTLACIVASGRRSLVGRRPSVKFQREAGPHRRPLCGKRGMTGHVGGPLSTTYMITEAGPRWRPDESRPGSSSKWEAPMNQGGRGGRSTPEARACM